MSDSSKTCWVITEGIAGTENGCIGLAEAMGVDFIVKRVKLRTPWKQLSPWIRLAHGFAPHAKSDSFDPPYPDLIITGGRKAVGMGIHLKKKSGGKTFLVHTQDPRVSPRLFDLVISPEHDRIRGDNVILTKGGLNRITREKLDAAHEKFASLLSPLRGPRVAVLIGGKSRGHTMTAENTARLTEKLLKLVKDHGASLMVTASRRTGEDNARHLHDSLKGENIFFWDGTGQNPYFGFMSWADYIIVTEDSVTMTTEALETGKPVYIAKLDGGTRRIDLFHKILQDQGYTRPFTGTLQKWSYTPPHDTQNAAAEILRRMKEAHV